MKLKKYTFEKDRRRIYIAPFLKRWVVVMEGEVLGEYPTAQRALEATREGRTALPPSGFSPASLEPPDDLSAWKCSDL